MKIAIAGTGYVGLVTGVCMAEHGHQLTCVDIDAKKIDIMQKGVSPIYEPGLDELLEKNQENIVFTTDYYNAYRDADVIFIGVGTPEKKDGSANLSYVFTVAGQIARSVEKDCVVVVKSTVPIGTNDRVEAYIRDNMANENVNVYVASNPDFLSQGTAIRDTMQPARIVIGTESEFAEEVMKKVYETYDVPKIFTNRRSAEMIKYASNNFLALKISYINEIANLCELVGADIEDVTKGMSYDERIGDKFLSAGIGYGGSCFPKDTKALQWLANFRDYELKTIKAGIETNESQKYKLIKKAYKYYDNLDGLTVAVLGLTFKPGTDDLREAPSLASLPILLEEGCRVRVWDPVGMKNCRKLYPTEIFYCNTIEEALTGADLCFIFTEWEEIKDLPVRMYENCMRKPIIIDGRNCYMACEFEDVQVIYDSIGRRTIDTLTKKQ